MIWIIQIILFNFVGTNPQYIVSMMRVLIGYPAIKAPLAHDRRGFPVSGSVGDMCMSHLRIVTSNAMVQPLSLKIPNHEKYRKTNSNGEIY